MNERTSRPPLPRDDFLDWLRREGASRYHDQHPFHRLMHDGRLERRPMQAWVANRY